MTGVNIQPITAVTTSEAEELAELVRQLSTSAQPLGIETLESIVSHDAMTLFVARRNGRIVGMLSLACFPTPTGVRAWIEDVVTSEAARGAGVGSALVQAALYRAREQSARTVDLTSRPSREAANRLYVRLGFTLRESNVYRYALT